MAFDQRSGVRPDFIPHLENEQRRLSPQSFLKNSFRGLAADVALTRKALEEFVGAHAQDSPLQRLLVRVLDKIDLISDAGEGCEQALYELPLSLAAMDSELKRGSLKDNTELRGGFNNFREKALNELLKVTSKRVLPGGVIRSQDESPLDFKIIGEGMSFWALRDDRSQIVALVAKKSESDSFERLKQRYRISKFFKQHGVHDQIDCKLITSAPFLHTFFTFAPGETIRAILLRAENTKSDEDASLLHSAVRKAGELMRRIADIKVEGLGYVSSDGFTGNTVSGGKIGATVARLFSHEEELLNRELSGSPQLKATLKLLNFNTHNFTRLCSWYEDTFNLNHRCCLTHSDPHLGNWQYDRNNGSGRVAMLDLERVAIVPEPVMLGWILYIWSRWPRNGEIDLSLFDSFMNGYEKGPQQREELKHLAMRAAAVHMYKSLIWPIWDDLNAPFSDDKAASYLESHNSPLIKFRSLLKLLEDIP